MSAMRAVETRKVDDHGQWQSRMWPELIKTLTATGDVWAVIDCTRHDTGHIPGVVQSSSRVIGVLTRAAQVV
jgi:hypothetical protein